MPSLVPLWVGRQLARARDLRHVRHPLRRATPTCAASTSTRSSRGIRCARTIPKEKRQPLIGPGAPRSADKQDRRSNRDEPATRTSRPAGARCTDDGSICRSSRMELQMGPSHPATHGTVRIAARARRRDHRRRRRPGRLPAPRLREGVRERPLLPGVPVHRSPELRLADDQQRRLRARLREALRHRGAASAASICA